jgi:hypothetical protein
VTRSETGDSNPVVIRFIPRPCSNAGGKPRAASRKVLGYMNEMARFCEYTVAESGGLARSDVQELNRELRRQLHLSRRPPGYFVPIELAQRSSTRDTAVERRHHLRIVD